jgi:hypothetical protein
MPSLTVLVNRYDGIDLPHDACRVLAIVGLPEVTSYTELTDMAVLSDSQAGLRRQMQRIEQGMGRGVRSNDDYCVVLLIGARLTARVKSPDAPPRDSGGTARSQGRRLSLVLLSVPERHSSPVPLHHKRPEAGD